MDKINTHNMYACKCCEKLGLNPDARVAMTNYVCMYQLQEVAVV